MRFYAIVIATLILLSGFASSTAQAGDPTLNASADQAFGQEINFSLQASNATEIERLTLFLRPELSTNNYTVNVPFQAGETISVTQSIDVDALELLPFSDVTYSWEVKTLDNIHRTPEQRLTYEDDRFGWQTMVRDDITAHWTGSGPLMGQSVIDTADQALARLTAIMPLEKVAPIDIYVYPSSADMRSAVHLAGFEEAAAFAPDLGVILIAAVNQQTVDSDLQQSIPYELAHLLLYRVAGEEDNIIPWWLRQGIAESARPNQNPRYEQLLHDAQQFNDTIPLWILCGQPRDSGERQELAVAQSASLVRFILENEAPGSIAKLLAAYLSGDDCEQGVQRILDHSLDELESLWLDSVREPSGGQQLFNDLGLWLLLLGAGTLLFIVIIRVTNQKEQR